MIFSYNWLNTYLDLPNPEELAEIMTFGGIEVEKIKNYGKDLDKIQIVEIIEVKKHPEADRLTICLIDNGATTKQVVCGAPNCRTGLITSYAPAGISLSEHEIKRIRISGVESEGMLCSEKDLGISDDHSGIMSLPEDATLGLDLESYLKLSDVIYEVEITPNRPDLLGILGIARDVAALTEKKLHLPEGFPTDGYSYPIYSSNLQTNSDIQFNLTNKAPKLCPRYMARVIKGVTVKESPPWLKKRLNSVGITPINNLVDITNFVMMEFGHPLHAFDYDLLDNHEIVVRMAKKGETISALDHKEYNLLETDLVIADSSKPVAIAGIIGGTDTSISQATKTIVLEAANFNNLSIRKTSNRLKIGTDSSYRFERNLSNETVYLISQRATDLICDICGGKEIDMIDSCQEQSDVVSVNLRVSQANKLLTTDLTLEDICRYLRPLGIIPYEKEQEQEIESRKELSFLIPPYRKDLTREIDLIEEIIRIHGYNNITEMEEREPITDLYWLNTKRYIADYLVHQGFYEAINSSFSEPAILKFFELSDDDFRSDYYDLINPLGSSFSMMRTTLIPGLLKNIQFNLHNGQSDIKLFELGKVYLKVDNQPKERYFLTGTVCGNIRKLHWKYKTDKSSIFSVKGYVEGLLSTLVDSCIEFRPYDMSYYQKGSAIQILLDGLPIGNLGKIDPLLARSLDIEEGIFVFDIDITELIKVGKTKCYEYQEINKYPPVARDVSFLIPESYQHQEIVKVIRETDRLMIRNVQLIDEYRGKGVPEDQRSLTYTLLISSSKGTLTDDAINNLLNRIRNRLKDQFSIEMR